MREVLVLSDRWDSMQALARWISDLGFHLVVVSGWEDLEAGLKRRPEFLLLDLGTSGLQASEFCKALSEDPYTCEIPVIVFGTTKEVAAFDVTAPFDDFLCLPASETEVQARVRRVLWRRHRIDTEEIVRVDNLVINLAKYEVTVGGEPVTLTLKEYELLRFLATHPGRVFSREYLLSQIWGLDYYGGMRTVDVHVRRLRAKLEKGGQIFIETVRGAGYRFRS